MLDYSGAVVVSMPTHRWLIPYATGGLGGLTMFERPSLAVNTTETFLMGNVGGGLKWYAPNYRWGCVATTDSHMCGATAMRRPSSGQMTATGTESTEV